MQLERIGGTHRAESVGTATEPAISSVITEMRCELFSLPAISATADSSNRYIDPLLTRDTPSRIFQQKTILRRTYTNIIRTNCVARVCIRRGAVRSTPSSLAPAPPILKMEPPGALPSCRTHLTYPKSIQDPCLNSLLTVTYALKVVTSPS